VCRAYRPLRVLPSALRNDSVEFPTAMRVRNVTPGEGRSSGDPESRAMPRDIAKWHRDAAQRRTVFAKASGVNVTVQLKTRAVGWRSRSTLRPVHILGRQPRRPACRPQRVTQSHGRPDRSRLARSRGRR
jgi:hypothetical protein